MPDRFTGFADPKFFRELAKNQTKEWFTAHKAAYEAGFVAPMNALLHELADMLDRAYPDCELGEPKTFRIHRDVRFSKDKSPYKTHVAGVLPVKIGAGKATETPAAMYVHVGFEERVAGAGLYLMDAAQLAKYRKAALDDAKGGELSRLVRALEKKGAVIDAGDKLKRVPRGIDPEHPRAELLKLKGLTVMYGEMPAPLLRKRDLLPWLVERGKQAAPLVRWLAWQTR